MKLRTALLTSTCIPLAFDPGMPLALPGSGVYSDLVRNMRLVVNSAQIAAGQYESITAADDLGTRDNSSALMLDYWNLTDDLLSGYEVMKARGVAYLPKFADEASDQYEQRLNATEFTNVYRDIIESLSGKPFEEAITLVPTKQGEGDKATTRDPDERIKEFCDDVDGAGSNLTVFAAGTFFNGINSAIDWIWVDYPTVDTSRIRSQADAKAENIRPFWSHVLGRNVLEATAKLINGKETLVRMRVLEPGNPNHVRLFERSSDGVVYWGLFKEVKETNTKSKWQLVDSGEITIGIIPFVPFATGRRDGRTYRYFPVMRDAADKAKQQYQKESALKWIKQLAAYPMLAANGIKPLMSADGKTPQKLAIGPNVVLYSVPDGQGNVGSWAYVQPSAEILKFLSEDIKSSMEQLRELGRQPLSAQSANLTVITTAFAAGKSKSAVGAWVTLLKSTLENALIITAMWWNIKDFKPELKIYNDFDDFASDQAADQGALEFMRTNKDLSHENYIKEQKRRNVIDPDMDEEENDKQLLDETPSEDDTGLEDDPAKQPLKKPVLVK